VASALAIDPMLPEAYMAIGNSHTFTSTRKRETGVALLRNAVDLKPSSATAHQWLGTISMEVGLTDESLQSLARARPDPLRSEVHCGRRAHRSRRSPRGQGLWHLGGRADSIEGTPGPASVDHFGLGEPDDGLNYIRSSSVRTMPRPGASRPEPNSR